MGHIHIRRQGLQSTKDKPPDTDPEDKIKTNVVFCTTVDSSTTNEGRIYSDLCRRFPKTSSKENKYIYFMYIYYFNAILTADMKNRSYKKMIRAFTELTKN